MSAINAVEKGAAAVGAYLVRDVSLLRPSRNW